MGKPNSRLLARISDLLLNNDIPFWRRPHVLIILVVMVYLVIGLFVVTQYGESLDEPPRISYANLSLSVYRGEKLNLQDEKGPFYGMVAKIGSFILVRFFRGWESIDGWHYMSFVAFVMGVFFFYRLCRRLIDPAPAMAATLLFGSQPVLWGHAFINPKDTPFMAFFLASVCLGLEMVDRWQSHKSELGNKLTVLSEFAILPGKLTKEWASNSRRSRWLLISLGLILAIWGFSYPFVKRWVAAIVSQAYNAPPSSWLGALFSRLALHAGQIPLQAYLGKAQTWYFFLYLSILLVFLLSFLWILQRIFPAIRDWALQPRVLLAGIFLGFTSDIRTLGPASGLLVAAYFIYKAGRKSIPFIIEYLGIGMLVAFIFWPYLWQNPLANYLSSLSTAADYPWEGPVIFAGQKYLAGYHPFYYLPATFALQLTETALLLIVGGCILAGFYLVKRANLRMDILLAGIWFVAPVAASILLNSTVYNNFRQFLFVVPPLFLFAGLLLQAIWNRLKSKVTLFVPLVILILMPGLYWDWQLHPYQYMYYNGLAGGMIGASHNYDMDYWFVTYKEAMEYINKVAPENSVVYFWLTTATAETYARPDLRLTSIQNPEQNLAKNDSFYAVIPTHYVGSDSYFPGSKVIYEINRGGATLAVVKLVNKDEVVQ